MAMINRHYNQGTPPFMAIEALCAEKNDNFAHLPHHDLESILYVILFICTFTLGPKIPRPDHDTPDTLTMKAWFSTDTINAIGRRKIADMCQPERTIIPGFTEYWKDFAPFALNLIQLCFPCNPAFPNQLKHKTMLSILDKAYNTVKESPTDMPVTKEKNLKRNESNDPPVPTKRMKRKLERV
jgi:protein kinase-like protein